MGQCGDITLSYRDFYFDELPKFQFFFFLQWVNQNGSLKIQKVTYQMKSLEKPLTLRGTSIVVFASMVFNCEIISFSKNDYIFEIPITCFTL